MLFSLKKNQQNNKTKQTKKPNEKKNPIGGKLFVHHYKMVAHPYFRIRVREINKSH